jgi:hypothetical protein
VSASETTYQIKGALRKRHDQPRNGLSRAWVYAEEVRVSTGWLSMSQERDAEIDLAIRLGREQFIDAFALHTWRSQRHRRVAYEVKATRSDLRRELEQPHKQGAAVALSNLFYLVAPPEVYRDIELPPAWGVMAYRHSGLQVEHRAQWRDTPPPPYSFMLSLARNIQQRDEPR